MSDIVEFAAPVWRTWTAADVVPRRRAVLRLMGVPADADERVGDIDGPFSEATETFRALAHPQGGFVEVVPSVAAVHLFDGHSRESSLRERLLEARRAMLFVVTVGSGPEDEAARLMAAGHYLAGVLLDSMASEATECAVDLLQAEVATKLAAGTVFRFSPGYGGWDLQAQPELLASVRAADHGVTLTPALMMLPRKSVSGVIVPRRDKDYEGPCDLCDRNGCDGRRSCRRDG